MHYKSRFNSSLKRDDVLSEVSSVFLNSGHKVDLKNPDMVIVVEIMRVRIGHNPTNIDSLHMTSQRRSR